MTVEPGKMCEACGRRVNKPKLPTSPDTRVVSIGRLPLERQEALADALKALAVYTGAVDHSYPAGSLLEVLVLLGGQQREEIRTYFDTDPPFAAGARPGPPAMRVERPASPVMALLADAFVRSTLPLALAKEDTDE